MTLQSPARRLIGPIALLVAAATLSGQAPPATGGRHFYADDPIAREPETQDASGAVEWEIELAYDLALNVFAHPGDPRPDVPAGNVNTIDEVPDSNWFTNRIGTREISLEEARRGPNTIAGPASGPWTVVAAKAAGFAPGFTVRDEQGELWYVSFDGNGQPEAATGAIAVASKLFWALGYYQVESYLTRMRPDQLVIGETATVTPPSGKRRPMRRSDVEAVLARAHRSPDGSYRALAGRSVPGKILGGFKYYGTRPDDPNDIVPHEHRRELRALKVFGAWTNLVDMKAGNTLDTIIKDGQRSVIRHYLQDVGSTFGTGAVGPREWDEGYEYLYEGDTLLKRLVSFGFYIRPWQTVDYSRHQAIGRFEGDEFDPEAWRSRVPVAAVLRARADDTFWAARRVMAFSDDVIRAIAATGEYSDPAAATHLAEVLIKRRDAIGRAYLLKVNPLVGFALDASGSLTFDNAAVRAGLVAAPAGGYRAEWSTYDRAGGPVRSLGPPTTSTTERMAPPSGLATAAGDVVMVAVSPVSNPPGAGGAPPIDAYFRRTGSGWQLVGLDGRNRGHDRSTGSNQPAR